jgi:outer membrane protein assembly factor BamA
MLKLLFINFIFIFSISLSDGILVNDIRVNGNIEIPEETILRYMNINKESKFSYEKISKGHSKLINSGLFASIYIDVVPNNSKVDIVANVVEADNIKEILKNKKLSSITDKKDKKHTLVGNITISGNYFLDENYIYDLIYTKTGAKYSLEDLKISKHNLESTGFFKSVEFNSFFEDSVVNVVFTLVENKFISEEIYIEDNISATNDEILDVIQLKTSTILNVNDLKKSINNIRNMYADKKDIADVTVDVLFKGSNLVLVISEPIVGEIYFIKKSYFGDDFSLKTNKKVLERVIRIKRGEPLKKSSLRDSIDSLFRLGFFKPNIQPDIRSKNSDKRIRDIYFILEENNGVGVNLSAEGSLNGNFKISGGFNDSNFLGTASSILINIDFDNSDMWKLKFQYHNPWIFDSRVSLGIEAFITNEPVNRNFIEYFANQVDKGFLIHISSPLFKNNLSIGLKQEFKEVSHFDLSNNLLDIYIEYNSTISLNYNSLNNYLDPTKGIFSSLSGSYSFRFPSYGVNYTNFNEKPNILSIVSESKLYFEFLSNKNTIASRFIISYAKFISNNKSLDLMKYSLGGRDTIRGFSNGVMFGNVYGLMNLEDRFSIYDDSFKLEFVTFFDIAFCANSFKELNDLDNIRSSVGVELRVKRFIMPVAFSMEVPLETNASPVAGLKIGYTF